MKKLLLALVLVAFVCAPAFASVQNVKISGSIQSDFVHRENYDFGGQQVEDEHQDVFRTLTMVQIDANLTDNVDATINLMNERIWEQVTNASQDIDLNLAYITLREMLYSPMTVVIGRQNFPIGNKLYFDGGINGVASSSINNVTDGSVMDGTDAIRFIFDYSPLTLQAFYAVVDEGTTGLTINDDDTRLYGFIATYEIGDDWNSLVEGVYLSQKAKNEVSMQHTNRIDLFGIRAASSPYEGLGLSIEYAHQGGEKGQTSNNNKDRDAHAVQFIANYALPVLQEYVPVVTYSYTKLSGDNTSDASGNTTNRDDTWHQWDPMYEGQVPGKIANRVFAATDAIVHSLSIQANPMEDVTSKLTVAKMYKYSPNQFSTYTLLQPDASGSASVAANVGEKYMGLELDLDTTYNYTEDVTFGLYLGFLKPGKVFKYRDAAKQVLASVKVAF